MGMSGSGIQHAVLLSSEVLQLSGSYLRMPDSAVRHPGHTEANWLSQQDGFALLHMRCWGVRRLAAADQQELPIHRDRGGVLARRGDGLANSPAAVGHVEDLDRAERAAVPTASHV